MEYCLDYRKLGKAYWAKSNSSHYWSKAYIEKNYLANPIMIIGKG